MNELNTRIFNFVSNGAELMDDIKEMMSESDPDYVILLDVKLALGRFIEKFHYLDWSAQPSLSIKEGV